jgi:leucyl aminopeptidase
MENNYEKKRLGEPFSGVFSTSDNLWSHLDAAGKVEQDRFWRMPFDDFYMRQIDSCNADLCNTGGRTAGVSLPPFPFFPLLWDDGTDH